MNFEWEVKKLGDSCLKIGSGATPKGGKEAYLANGPYRLIRSQNIYNEGFSASGLAYIDEDQARKLEGVAVEENDVLLNITGDSVARVCLAPKKYLPARVNQHVAIIRPKPDVFDSRYVRYFLASKQQQSFMLGLAAAGATRNALTKGMIEGFEIPAPPLEIQNSIADTLGALDDRITLLRETNKTLESIAQAIFKSWFIDFDPVRAKIEGRAPAGMDEETAALFPDELVESELGLVPKGWGTVKFEEFINRLSVGKKYDQKSSYPQGAVPVLDQGRSGVIGYHNDEPGVIASLDEPVVVFANHTCYMRLITFPFSAIQNVLPFKGRGVDTVWAFFATRDRQKFQEYKGHWPDFVIQKTSLPDAKLTKVFRRLIDPLIRKIRLNEMQVETLTSLRDTMLPRLISGKLRIAEDELESQT